ncbi:MAG TPA: MYXO-CTERM sorting domain-containing protein [Candidatus Nitrosotalea sp.]|nr:MYXO-CTERM sorting domain-containing protein [Candidatus Nitrosotalea sp.]
MKTFSMFALVVLSASGTLGQGTVNFQNTATTLIQYCENGVAIIAPVGSLTVGLYYGPAGTIDPTTMVLLATTGIGPVAGRYAGGTVTTPNTTAGGAAAVFEVRAWSGPYPSYEAALASGNPSISIGRSGLVTVPVTGNPSGVPPTTPATLGAPGFVPGPLGCVPEPPTFALSVLGLGALWLGHRRRQAVHKPDAAIR